MTSTVLSGSHDVELAELLDRLTAAARTNIGFPGATDFADFDAKLAPFRQLGALINCGSPEHPGLYPLHTKQQELEAIDTLADLFRAPQGDRWGYVTANSSEGNEYGLLLARSRFEDAVEEAMVYVPATAHHCVFNALGRLRMPYVEIRTDDTGEVDYRDLAAQVGCRRHLPVIVVACIGGPVTESVDDVRRIVGVLDDLAVRRRWIHADAALSGIPLATLDPAERPGFDFADGTTSLVFSGHKFVGSPEPFGVFLIRSSDRPDPQRSVTYTGAADAPLSNSRSGYLALLLWLTLRARGVDGLRRRAEQARDLAAYTHRQLRRIGWPASRLRHACTVVLDPPPAPVLREWPLATTADGRRSHIVCMPGLTRADIDRFITALHAAAPGVAASGDRAVATVGAGAP